MHLQGLRPLLSTGFRSFYITLTVESENIDYRYYSLYIAH